mgnify:CR=1 FL=1
MAAAFGALGDHPVSSGSFHPSGQGHAGDHRKDQAERFYMNLERYGNTSAASIPIALAEMEEKGLLREGQRVMLAGFGGGLSWGAAEIAPPRRGASA